MIKNVRVLTLPYLEFEFCNVYRATQGKTFPLIHRHPDAVVLLWCKGDHDHVFFVTVAQLLPCLQDMNLADWSMVVFWNESTGSDSKKGPDVGLDFTDQPAPSPHVPQQPPVTPGDDMDYPGSGTHVPVPGGDEDLDMPHDPDTDGGHPPGGGPQGPGPGYGPSPGEPALPMEYHEESPPPGGPPDAPGAPPQYANPDQVLSPPVPWPAPPSQIVPVPIPPHPQFPVPHSLRPPSPRNVSRTRARGQHPDDTSKAKSRTVVGPPVVLLPGQSAGKKDPPSTGDFPGCDEPASSSSAPAPVPGLPVLPAPTTEPPVPADGEDTDSDATVDYRGDSLLALVAGDDDVLIRLPTSFAVPSFVPLDGDEFASWLTKQDKIKAGTITQEMQRKYAKEIRAAKLEEFKSYLDNDAIRLTDRRKLRRDVNFLTGRWVLTVKVDKNGYFSKFKARWVCRGFQDKFAWDQQTDSPTAANHFWDLFHLDLKTAFLQGEHYNLSSRMVVVQLPQDIGLPTWMVGLCLRPVYGLNDAPRRWWNRLDKFLRSVGMEPTRADRCTYVAYDGIQGKKSKSYLSAGSSSQEEDLDTLRS
eukprot:s9792_g3.t1